MRLLAEARTAALLAAFVDIGIAGDEYPATPELAHRLGCSQQQIDRSVATLREAGRIRAHVVYRPHEGQHATRREIEFLTLPLGCLTTKAGAKPRPAAAAQAAPRSPPPATPTTRGKLAPVVDVERARALLLAAKPLTMPPSWNCQYIESEDVFPPVYCGASRCHPESAYCDRHYDVTHRAIDDKYKRKSKPEKELVDG